MLSRIVSQNTKDLTLYASNKTLFLYIIKRVFISSEFSDVRKVRLVDGSRVDRESGSSWHLDEPANAPALH